MRSDIGSLERLKVGLISKRFSFCLQSPKKGAKLQLLSTIHLKISTAYVGCANKDLDGSLGKFIQYCRILALLPVIPYTQRNNW